MLLNEQANNEQIILEKSQMNTGELNPLSILWAGKGIYANDVRMFPSAREGYILHAAKSKKDDEDDEKDEEDDYYNEEKEEDENPFDKEPTDKDIVEEDIPIVDPEEDLIDDDEEVPYN